MLGLKSGGIVFTIPSTPGSKGIGVGSSIMGDIYPFPKSDGTSGGTPPIPLCVDSVWNIDGDEYIEAGEWLPTCPAFRGA